MPYFRKHRRASPAIEAAMKANRKTSTLLAGLIAGALTCGGAPALAQSLAQSAGKPKPVASKPVAAKPTAAAKRAAANSGSGDYWSANTDLGQYGSNVVEYDRPTGQTRPLGRVPLQTGPGSVGFTSQPSKVGQFTDGRTVPGHDAYTQAPSSYVGLSLSVPSDSKSFPIVSPSTLWNAAGGNNGW